jgi:pseudouridine kinase
MNLRVACVGAAAVDVKARSTEPPLHWENSLGEIQLSVGGAARNSAEICARLGWDVYLLSCIGTDPLGDLIVDQAIGLGINTSAVERYSDVSTACYVSILDITGTPRFGVFDGAVLERLTPDYIHRYSKLLASVDLIVSHTLLPLESLELLAEVAKRQSTPICVNLASSFLASRALRILHQHPIIAANQAEAEAISSTAIGTLELASAIGEEMIAKGARAALITLGGMGGIYCDDLNSYQFEAVKVKMADTTGAGDALCSALLVALHEGSSVEDSIKFGLAAAALTIESYDSVDPRLSRSTIGSKLESVESWEIRSKPRI